MNNEIEHDKDRLLVAEYTLGLLDPKDVAALEKRLPQEPQLRTEFIFWSEKFALLTNELPGVTPSAQVKIAIRQRLFAETAANTSDTSASSWWAWIFSPKGLGSAVMAVVLAFGLVYLIPKPFTPDYTAVLQTQDNNLVINAHYDADKHLLRMTPIKGQPAPRRDIELWLIAGDGLPVSLGVLKNIESSTTHQDILLPRELSVNINGATLALSDEPLGGSPTGQPTGAVLATAIVQVI